MRTAIAIAATLAVARAAMGGDFRPSMATCLGGDEKVEEWTAVEVAPNGHVVVAGSAPGYTVQGVEETWLMAGGYGIVMRIDPKTNQRVSVTRMGDWIEDMQIDLEGRIALCGSFGLAVDGKNKLAIVGGFNTHKHNSPHMKDHPIHMPFLTAYTYDGKVKWVAYDFPAKDVYAENTCADSRVQRLAIGADGYLYMGGYIHGGDYVWRHDPLDVTKRVKVDVGYDGYSPRGRRSCATHAWRKRMS